MNQEIKVTKCYECPMLIIDGAYNEYHSCLNRAFYNLELFDEIRALETSIHPNCPIKGKTITYKIGDDENI